jgi:hypothetical protein
VQRTSVHHVEGDRDEGWMGFSCTALCDWMTQQLAPAEEEAAPPPSRPDPVVRDLSARIVGSGGEDLSRLVRADRPWAIAVQWRSEAGREVDPTGRWHVEAIARRFGAGRSLSLPARAVAPSAAEGPGTEYLQARLEIPAGTQADLEVPYGITVMLAYRRRGRALVAAFADLGLIQFHLPQPRQPAEATP